MPSRRLILRQLLADKLLSLGGTDLNVKVLRVEQPLNADLPKDRQGEERT